MGPVADAAMLAVPAAVGWPLPLEDEVDDPPPSSGGLDRMGSLSMAGKDVAWMEEEDTCVGPLLVSGRVRVNASSEGLESVRAAAGVGAVIFGE